MSSNYDDLKNATIAIYGLDIKITPNNDVKIIEMNGVDSGAKGFSQIGEKINPSRMRYDIHNQKWLPFLFGEEKQNEQIGYFLAVFKRAIQKYPGEPIAQRSAKLEEILNNKLRQDSFFDTHRDIKPVTRAVTKHAVQQAIHETTTEHIVVKPNYGRIGNGVHVVSTKDERRIDEILQQELTTSIQDKNIVEPFIPSKELEYNGEKHDGCMRYIAIAYQWEQAFHMHHLGGYWRLAPEPLNTSSEFALKANLCNGAIPMKATEEDIELVRETVNNRLPKIFLQMLQQFKVTKVHS